MKKWMLLFVAMAFIAFGYTAGAFAAGMDDPMGKEARDVSTWIGKEVKNTQGEDLGEVHDFVREEGGDVSLVIISHGGFMGIGDKKVAVPFDALSFNYGEDYVLLDATKEQVANAPMVGDNESLTDSQFAEEVQRYFGERPEWTDRDTKTRGYFGSDDRIDIHEGAEY